MIPPPAFDLLAISIELSFLFLARRLPAGLDGESDRGFHRDKLLPAVGHFESVAAKGVGSVIYAGARDGPFHALQRGPSASVAAVVGV